MFLYFAIVHMGQLWEGAGSSLRARIFGREKKKALTSSTFAKVFEASGCDGTYLLLHNFCFHTLGKGLRDRPSKREDEVGSSLCGDPCQV